MDYNENHSSIEPLIYAKLKEIEKKEQIKILHAIESGSRAWGFASPDSDYDVRFIYIRPLEYYLGLQPKTDFIDWELNETLDINGWDLSKVFQHIHKSNATMFEWSHSPIIYDTTPEWKQVQKVSEPYFSCRSAIYHYYGTAKKNYEEYLTEELVKYKKYFYVLRPILACRWIEQKKCPPPVLFQKLMEEVLEAEMKETVEKLVELKKKMIESEKGERIEKLNAYLENYLCYYKEKADTMEDDRNPDWDSLNQTFQNLLYHCKYFS